MRLKNVQLNKYWDQFTMEWRPNSHSNDLLARHKRETHLRLVARWAEVTNNLKILKTDLFEEAFGSDQFLFDLAEVSNDSIGIDISWEISSRARKNAKHYGLDISNYICCDVRRLPLRNDSIDLIISNSTLDHFPDEADIIAALRELRRVLRIDGILIITMDNKSNITYPPYMFVRLWMLLGLASYFIGRTLSAKELRHALGELGFRVEESAAIIHYPYPLALVRGVERFLCWLGRGRFDSAVIKSLAFLDKLDGKRVQYLTGRYVTVKAVKV